MSTSQKKRRVGVLSISVLTIAVVSTVGLTIAGVSTANATRTSPEQVFALLTSATAPDDRLPTLPVDEFGQGGLKPDSARFVGADGSRSFWVAEDNASNICIIVSLGDPGETIAWACNRVDQIAKSGQSLGAQGSDGVAYVAYLLPDSADTGALQSGWTVVGTNVVVKRADANAPTVFVLVGDGGQIELRSS